MKRAIRSSSSTTRMTRFLKVSSTFSLLPDKGNDLLIRPGGHDLDEADAVQRPDHDRHVGFQVRHIFSVLAARILDRHDGIGRIGEYVHLSHDRVFIKKMNDNAWHNCFPSQFNITEIEVLIFPARSHPRA